jgi:2-keto-4-pentenoate hydratase
MRAMRTDSDERSLAERILAAADARSSLGLVTDDRPDFGLADAYRVAEAVTGLRIARGEQPVGWKIGFTNRAMWDEYGVREPIWAPVYDRTVLEVSAREVSAREVSAREVSAGPARCPIGHLVAPRIEPEIVLKLARTPEPGMDEAALMDCVEAVAHGYEIVHCLFPDWRFRLPDMVATFGLHGLLCHGPFTAVGGAMPAPAWRSALEDFTLTLDRDGTEVEQGHASAVLGGPLSALRHFVEGSAASGPADWRPRAGDVITTGTLTRPYPIAPGERWATRFDGLPLPGLDVLFTA